jgi:hypothetical protein
MLNEVNCGHIKPKRGKTVVVTWRGPRYTYLSAQSSGGLKLSAIDLPVDLLHRVLLVKISRTSSVSAGFILSTTEITLTIYKL